MNILPKIKNISFKNNCKLFRQLNNIMIYKTYF